MKISIGCDQAGFYLKEDLKSYLIEKKHEVMDVGCHSTDQVNWAEYSAMVCEHVISGECERGIILCGTGVGMAMMANKIPGIRAVTIENPFTAARCVPDNDANVCCMGSRVVTPQIAKMLLDIWLEAKYEENASTWKINRMAELQREYAEKLYK
ncbi:MAG: ribose 5-phosphate isomerase B [Clostridiales bacterium]|nr:ribose 5-phosphate isomerase B [Clostridiales bacterium]